MASSSSSQENMCSYWTTTKLVYDDGKEIIIKLDPATLRQLEGGDADLMTKIRRNYEIGQIPEETDSADTSVSSAESSRSSSAEIGVHLTKLSPLSPSDTGICFTHEETLFLIDQYSHNKDNFKNPLIKQKVIWQDIQRNMNVNFHKNFTKEQVEGRWKTVLAGYRKFKTSQNLSGREKKDFPYEKQLDDILGDRHDIAPVLTISSLKRAPSIDESKTEEQENDNTKTEGEENEKGQGRQCQKKKRRLSRPGGMTVMMQFLQDYTKKQEEREQERLEKEQAMHNERMAVLTGFLDVMKEQLHGKQPKN